VKYSLASFALKQLL